MKKNISSILLILTFLSPVYSNEYINSEYNKYFEFLALNGTIESPTLIYHSYSNNKWDNNSDSTENPWGDNAVRNTTIYTTDNYSIKVIAPDLFNSYNSKYPSGINDGALWQGRGYNSRLRTGVFFQSEFFSMTFAPEVLYMQNSDFTIMQSAAENKYGYISSGIDTPQRFGDKSIKKLNWGETEIRFNYDIFTLGVSNENVKIGPACINPLILSGNASGFPHVDMGIKKWITPTGTLEGRILWGLLKESDYFDSDADNNYRYLNLMSIAYSPVFWPELTVGFARTIMCNVKDFSYKILDNMLNPVTDSSLGFDKLDQKASFFFDFHLPAYKLNLYNECAYEDHLVKRGILLIPGHTLAYTIGLKKSFRLYKNHFLSLTGELTELQQSRDYEITMGVGGGWYRHHIVTQGHTNEGQNLGAGIGTGANSQYIGLDYYNKRGSIGINIMRYCRDSDYLYIKPVTLTEDIENSGFSRMNIEMSYGISCLLFIDKTTISLSYSYNNNLNRDYISLNDIVNHRCTIGINYKI